MPSNNYCFYKETGKGTRAVICSKTILDAFIFQKVVFGLANYTKGVHLQTFVMS